jgi:hypothetical protein
MFQSKTKSKNYNLIPECREFIYRLLRDMRLDEIGSGGKLMEKVLVAPEENEVNIGDINKDILTTSSGETSIPAHTLLTFEFNKSSLDNLGIDDWDLSSDPASSTLSTYFRIRSKKEMGKKMYIEQLVKYIKDNITKNDFVYSSLLSSSDGWSETTYNTNLFDNIDTLLQFPDVMQDFDTNWLRYEFQINLNIYFTNPKNNF